MGKVINEKFNVFRVIADKQKEKNRSQHQKPDPEDEIWEQDDKGRDIVDITKFSLLEHGNDPNIRLDICGFPRRGRDFMLEYDYKQFLKDHGVDFDVNQTWDWQFLVGPRGTGKTTLADRQAWEWLKPIPNRTASFLSIADWIRNQQLSFNRSYDFNRENISVELPSLNPFVVLDDFDKHQYTKWQILKIFHLIDYLYRTDCKVIITSNRTFEQIMQESNNAIEMAAALDRIKERSRGAIISMNWGSYR